jgi:septal ring-binding cell division protein DamX
MRRNYRLIVLLLLLLLLLLVGIGALLFQRQQSQVSTKSTLPTTVTMNREATDPSVVVVSDSGWVTYTNDSYRFAFGYPNTFTVQKVTYGKNQQLSIVMMDAQQHSFIVSVTNQYLPKDVSTYLGKSPDLSLVISDAITWNEFSTSDTLVRLQIEQQGSLFTIQTQGVDVSTIHKVAASFNFAYVKANE